MDHLSDWLSRKLEQGLSVREPRTAEAVYDKIFSPMSMYARVKLHAEPASQFEFHSIAVWPEKQHIRYTPESMTNAERGLEGVLDGIIDELLVGESGEAITRVRLTLLEVECRKHSPPKAFYHAARDAVRQILDDNAS